MDAQVSYPDYITPDIKALIGREAQMEAWDEVERGAIRRFVQAVMDPDPVYWDDGYAAKTRYRGVVAPPMYPMYAFRFPPNAADPLDAACNNPHFHGGSFMPRFGLPEPPVPLQRVLNGGNDVEFLALARPGDRLRAKSTIEDIYQKNGRNGPMVFIRMKIVITNQDGHVLLINRQTSIRR
ncbi:MAG TPA: MaoC family dehydratase N-terminal domain-containing protein [bacterium]|nr:MaoC family dehydratase N-terminal domain-containing protein [bacterium]